VEEGEGMRRVRFPRKEQRNGAREIAVEREQRKEGKKKTSGEEGRLSTKGGERTIPSGYIEEKGEKRRGGGGKKMPGLS